MEDEQVSELFDLFDHYTHMADAVLHHIGRNDVEGAKRIIHQQLNPTIDKVKALYEQFEGTSERQEVQH